jgi:hypothetical protein
LRQIDGATNTQTIIGMEISKEECRLHPLDISLFPASVCPKIFYKYALDLKRSDVALHVSHLENR